LTATTRFIVKQNVLPCGPLMTTAPDNPIQPGSEAETARELAFTAVNVAFSSLGRVCVALDQDFCVRHVSSQLDAVLGPGAAARVAGQPIVSVLGPELFGPEGPLRRALLAGEKREGWRALLRLQGGGSRLLSVTAAPLQHDPQGVCDPAARYILVMRPAEEESASLYPPIANLDVPFRSEAMARVSRLVDTLQHSESTVLITGESGTGKEVMARVVHANSPRRHGPFVAVNAAALPGELLESELFGHVRGSFTGALRDRVGRFESAIDGTLFLDEVADLPLHLQVKLLRVLQEHTFDRVGENTPRKTNARIIAATHQDLRRAVGEGRFREDLYYRLRVIPIELPPLRSRREDIDPIARVLLSRVGARTGRALRFSPETLRALLTYDWPGNVRELENALEYAATVCAGQTLQPEDLPPEVIANGGRRPDKDAAATPVSASSMPATATAIQAAAQQNERALLKSALEAHRWNRAETAKALGLSRSTLWRRMRALGLVGDFHSQGQTNR
jgi:DNA-binding NtrC family response regulator